MSTIQTRIVELRKKLNLKQKDVAQSLGVAISTVSSWENMSIIPENSIVSICLIYNVNESWLRTGEGEIFNPSPKVKNLDKNEVVVQYILDIANSLSDENRRILLNAAKKLMEEYPLL